ncbi:hypothetical protein TNCV_3410991 [Trichonephila clavipes]|nr:hypothetical protein TNCV_3410991 [Trichonephila clavipes]
MADLLPRNRALPNTTSQRGDTSQVLPSMRSPSSALVAPFNRLVYSQILTRWTATAGLDLVQSGRPIFDNFFQNLWPYIGNNTANVVFQMVERLWPIRIDQSLYIAPQKIV